MNYFLVRDLEAHPYQGYGRMQTVEQASELDTTIKAALDAADIEYQMTPIATAVDDIVLDIQNSIL